MNLVEILNKIGYVELQDFGTQYRTRPLYRSSGNNTSLSINKANGCWYDFGSREGGVLLGLVKLTLGLPSMKAAQEYIGDATLSIEEPGRHRYELLEAKKFDKNLLLKLNKDHTYWESRGVSSSIIEQFGGGTTYNGRMCYRYVFPIFDEKNELVGFSGRRLNNNSDYPKWKHIGAKSNWCFPLKLNRELLFELKEVILVESIGDMLALWEAGIKNTLVTFGVDISVKIVELLLRLDCQRIFVAFNNDADNEFIGNHAAEEGRQFLLKHFDPQQVVVAIPNEKDFGEMNLEQINIWKNQFQLRS